MLMQYSTKNLHLHDQMSAWLRHCKCSRGGGGGGGGPGGGNIVFAAKVNGIATGIAPLITLFRIF